jgi:organic radical activating enzyme
VKDSWDVHAHPKTSVEEMVSRAKNSGTNIVVITGGEPTMHDLTALTIALQKAGLHTHIETSGAYEITGTWDWICFSPKKFMAPHPSVAKRANELKVVIFHKSDLEWAEEFAKQVSQSCELYLQPEWSKVKEMSALIVNYVKANPKWKISVQAHKYIDVP